MTTRMIGRCILPLSVLATTAALGQEVLLEPAAVIPRNRFGASVRLAFNMDVKFKNIGGFAAQSNPGLAIGGVDHSYDDGFNNVDVTGNDHGPGFENTTWFWGYDNDSQYDPSGTGTLSMHSTSGSGAASVTDNEDPHLGFELFYDRELFRSPQWRWGLETAVGYTGIGVKDNSPINAPVTVLTDTYQLNGVIPPSAPYAGTFNGPGPVISDTPSRSFSTSTASVTGQREFHADLFCSRFGPYFEIPVSPKVTLMFNTGLSMAYVQSDFRFSQIMDTGGGPVSVSGSNSDNDVLFGGYMGGNVIVSVDDQMSAFVGALWQGVGTYTHHGSGGQMAELDLNNSIFVSFGLLFTF